MRLRRLPPVVPGVAALPRIADEPENAAAARINRVLKENDLSARDAAADCSERDGWHRRVAVTMTGPRWLSVVAYDDWYCGGAYPDYSTTPLVFDLSSGAPVDWTNILPAPLRGQKAANASAGGDAVTSPALWKVYAEAALAEAPKGCAEPFADAASFGTGLLLWPDAAAAGLALQGAEWPHVVKACEAIATIPTARLRALGLDAGFIDAIDEAHRRGRYDRTKN